MLNLWGGVIVKQLYISLQINLKISKIKMFQL